VHALVRAILLRLARQDPLVLNAETHPPDIQLGESVNAGGRERDAIVGADRPRQAMRAKEAIKDRAHALAFRRRESMAGDQEPRVLIGDRQRVTIDAVPGPEMAFEVGRPEITVSTPMVVECELARLGLRTCHWDLVDVHL
jgi:hypothetical protein